MRTSESITALITALIAARRLFAPVVKQAKGQVGKDREFLYADLGTLLASTMPPLMDQGLMTLQVIDVATATLITRLVHISGEWCETAYPLKLDLPPQQFGSLLTYGRRYSLQSLLCLAAEDDDGATAQPPAGRTKAAAKPATAAKPALTSADFITDPQRRRLLAIARERGWEKNDLNTWLVASGIGSTTRIRTNEYDDVVARLQQAAAPLEQQQAAPDAP